MSPAVRTPRRRITAAAAVALAGITLAASGCTVANSRHGGYDPNTLRIVLSQEPPTLEPCESSLTSTGIVVRSNITEPLIERDPNSGDLQPLLATKWRQLSPTQWEFDIRDGVTFSNGAPFTAQDAAFSIDRAVNSDLNCNVDGYVFGDDPLQLSTPNDSTLVVGTKSPDPILPPHGRRPGGAEGEVRRPDGPAYADMAVLRGDPSDGLPGVPGIGEKTAAQLIHRYGSLVGILDARDAGDPGLTATQKKRLVEARDYLVGCPSSRPGGSRRARRGPWDRDLLARRRRR